MIELSRTVRFCVRLSNGDSHDNANARHNTFAGWPSMRGIGAFYELVVRCRGEPDATTGYLLNISAIDRAVRETCIPIIERAVRTRAEREPSAVLAEMIAALERPLGETLVSIGWRLTPYYCIAMTAATTERVSVSQQFEFSAAHRLHCASLSPARNREIFGKCDNPNGHGHNYRLQVTVNVPCRPADERADTPAALSLQTLERIVNERVIQRFDHKHLNLDTEEFANLNPSVENIARVCHGLLVDHLSAAGGRLEHVTVWETEKTSCTYPA